jgi:hypothetical protein
MRPTINEESDCLRKKRLRRRKDFISRGGENNSLHYTIFAICR